MSKNFYNDKKRNLTADARERLVINQSTRFENFIFIFKTMKSFFQGDVGRQDGSNGTEDKNKTV